MQKRGRNPIKFKGIQAKRTRAWLETKNQMEWGLCSSILTYLMECSLQQNVFCYFPERHYGEVKNVYIHVEREAPKSNNFFFNVKL